MHEHDFFSAHWKLAFHISLESNQRMCNLQQQQKGYGNNSGAVGFFLFVFFWISKGLPSLDFLCVCVCACVLLVNLVVRVFVCALPMQKVSKEGKGRRERCYEERWEQKMILKIAHFLANTCVSTVKSKRRLEHRVKAKRNKRKREFKLTRERKIKGNASEEKWCATKSNEKLFGQHKGIRPNGIIDSRQQTSWPKTRNTRMNFAKAFFSNEFSYSGSINWYRIVDFIWVWEWVWAIQIHS